MSETEANIDNSIETTTTATTKVDIFRDTPIRLLGYCNEVGEAFRNLVSRRVVQFSYVVSTTYCIADASSKAKEIHENTESIEGKKSPERKAVETFVEAAVWQGLASVIIPGYTINRICWLSSIVLRRSAASFIAPNKQKLLVTGIGMSSIPFIIKPIDFLVDQIMEKGVDVAGKVENALFE